MFRAHFMISLITAMAIIGSNVAIADDLVPPAFRGQPGSVFALWELSSDQDFSPDQFNAVPYQGTIVFPTDPTYQVSNLVFSPTDGGWIGGPDGGTASFLIPNIVDDLDLKLLQLQIKYTDPTGTGSPTGIGVIANDSVAGEIRGSQLSGTTFDDVQFRVEGWQIQPNPDIELVVVFVPQGVLLDQVVVDTISVPEASTVVMIGVASLGLGVYRITRRRTK